MKRIIAMSLALISLVAVVACTAPERVGATADQSQPTNHKLERAERDFFDRGGSFK